MSSRYDIECDCGTRLAGDRRVRGVVVDCPACRLPHQVFPQSPLPGAAYSKSIRLVPSLAGRGSLRFWLVPAAAGVFALAAVSVTVAMIVHQYRKPPAPPDPEPQTAAQAQSRAKHCREALKLQLSDGSYRLACHTLGTLKGLGDRFPGEFPRAERARTQFELRQAELLADLLPESIDEILRHSLGLADREWENIFRERYFNRAVLFDAQVHRDATGQVRLDFAAEVAGGLVTIDCQHLTVFHGLPLVQPQRVFFGVRLAEAVRTGRDAWTISFRPDSGVLFTDPAFLAGLSLVTDDSLRDVLSRQQTWIADVAGGS